MNDPSTCHSTGHDECHSPTHIILTMEVCVAEENTCIMTLICTSVLKIKPPVIVAIPDFDIRNLHQKKISINLWKLHQLKVTQVCLITTFLIIFNLNMHPMGMPLQIYNSIVAVYTKGEINNRHHFPKSKKSSLSTNTLPLPKALIHRKKWFPSQV